MARGDSRLAFKTVDIVMVVAVFVLGAGLAVWYFVPDLVRTGDWVTTDGLVSSVSTQGGEVTITYVFEAGGVSREGEDVVPETALESVSDQRLEQGDRIEVSYPEDDPNAAVSEFTTLGNLSGLIAAIISAIVLAVVLLFMISARRGRRTAPAPTRGAALLRCVDGSAVVGADRRSSELLVLHPDRVDFVRGKERTPVTWDAISSVRIAPRRGLRSLSASHDLTLTIGSADRIVPLRAPPGRPLPRQADFDAVVAVLSFCLAYIEARAGLGSPEAVAALVDGMQDAISRTRTPPAAARRWPQATADRRRRLDTAMLDMCRASGVELFGRRTIRGHRLEPDPLVVDAARAWIPADLASVPIGDDVLAAAVDAVQGPRPSWPLDLLLIGEIQR